MFVIDSWLLWIMITRRSALLAPTPPMPELTAKYADDAEGFAGG